MHDRTYSQATGARAGGPATIGLTPTFSRKDITTDAAKPHPKSPWPLQRFVRQFQFIVEGVALLFLTSLPASNQLAGEFEDRVAAFCEVVNGLCDRVRR